MSKFELSFVGKTDPIERGLRHEISRMVKEAFPVGKTDPIERGLRPFPIMDSRRDFRWKNRPDRKGIKTKERHVVSVGLHPLEKQTR